MQGVCLIELTAIEEGLTLRNIINNNENLGSLNYSCLEIQRNITVTHCLSSANRVRLLY